MDIEIIEFFPTYINQERATLSGTLRIRVIFADVVINLLGVFVSRSKNSWHFNMPGRKATHHETGQEVRYPYFSLEKEMQRELMDQIRLKGKEFIEARLADSSRPLIFPVKKEKRVEETKYSRVNNDASEVRETASIAKPEVKPSIASKVWMDPPKRNRTAKRFK